MKKLFNDILSIEDVKGVMLFSLDGQIVFSEFNVPLSENPENKDWTPFLEALNGVREADLIYEKNRVYFRRASSGYLIILMEAFAPVAMVRLNCDLLLPSLKQKKLSKGVGRLFRRKK